MKVCMVVPDADVKGGIASVVNGYREYNFEPSCEVRYVESYRDGSKWQKFIKAIKGYFEFGKVISKDRPDIVHIHSSFGPSFYRKMPFIYLASWKKIPIVNHIHGADFDTFYKSASSLKKNRIKKVYNKCQILLALSEEWKKNLEMIVPADKVVILENYCRIPDLQKNIKKKQTLFMGEIGKRKGCFDLPEIYRKAVAKGEKVPLIVAGDGALSEVKNLFEEKNLSDIVSFPGWIRGDDKLKILRESAIFLFPTYHEGMPMAVLEAMAYGMAIISTNVGGIPKLIEDGVSGYLCEPGDVERLADRLAELFMDEEKRKSFGDAARQHAIKNYSMESHIAKLLVIYNRVLQAE